MRGQKGRYAVTLSRSIYEPFTTYSERRDLREKAFRAFIGRGETGGPTDNGQVVKDTLRLRAEKAKLVGYDSYADLKLDDTMAKNPPAVLELLGAGVEKGAREGGDRPGRTGTARRSRRQQQPARGLGLAPLPGKAARRKIRLRRSRAEALPAARAHHRRLLRRRRTAVRPVLRGEEGHRGLASRRARLRGQERRRQLSRPVPGRLFRTALEALGRLDERAASRATGSARARRR